MAKPKRKKSIRLGDLHVRRGGAANVKGGIAKKLPSTKQGSGPRPTPTPSPTPTTTPTPSPS
jgi:hypothetical protein